MVATPWGGTGRGDRDPGLPGPLLSGNKRDRSRLLRGIFRLCPKQTAPTASNSALDGQVSPNKAIIQLPGNGETLDVAYFREVPRKVRHCAPPFCIMNRCCSYRPSNPRRATPPTRGRPISAVATAGARPIRERKIIATLELDIGCLCSLSRAGLRTGDTTSTAPPTRVAVNEGQLSGGLLVPGRATISNDRGASSPGTARAARRIGTDHGPWRPRSG
jgi:hypothetical protein